MILPMKCKGGSMIFPMKCHICDEGCSYEKGKQGMWKKGDSVSEASIWVILAENEPECP